MCCLWFAHDCTLVGDSSRCSEEIVKISNCAFQCFFLIFFFLLLLLSLFNQTMDCCKGNLGKTALCRAECVKTFQSPTVPSWANCSVGLVVKVPASRAADLGLNTHLHCGNFSRSSHTSDLKISNPARRLTLQGQHWDWFAWCQYTVARWGRKFDLQVLSQCVSM